MKIRLLYRDEKTIGVWLERYGVEERKGIRSVSGRKWLANENVWTIPYTIAAVERLLDAYRDCAIECDQRVSKEMLFIQEKLGQLSAPVKEIPSKLEISQCGSARRTELCDALVARGYSSKTIKAYLSQVERFFLEVEAMRARDIELSVQNYTLELLKKGLYHAYVNQAIRTLKFYYRYVLMQPNSMSYVRPKEGAKTAECAVLE